MFGGDVKGGKIMGKYPSFGLSDPTNIGRGRVMPTTSWEAVFYGVSQWMGISLQDQLDYVLPNSQNFGCNLYTDYDLFKSGSNFLRGCGGKLESVSYLKCSLYEIIDFANTILLKKMQAFLTQFNSLSKYQISAS